MPPTPAPPAPFAMPQQSMIKTFAPMVVLYAMRGIDFAADEKALLILRVAFGVCHAIALLLSLFLLMRISQTKDMRTVTVEGEKQPFHEHDRRHILQGLKTLVMTCAIVIGMHAKWSYYNPLVLTSLQAILGFVDGPSAKLLSAHVFGKDIDRPFETPQPPSWLQDKKAELTEKKEKSDGNAKKTKSKKAN
ncbi:inorganic phosphate transporter Pho88 [Pavlovales sp. CCMP2436]|nr:inorganic phosphate transporter Pho88 [Pavlovales sp. CCMP2436]